MFTRFKLRNPLYVLIALWLWCAAAAGETISVTPQMLERGNHRVTLSTPCNWDKDVSKVKIQAVYENPEGHPLRTEVVPTQLKRQGLNLFFVVAPETGMRDGMPLHHMDVEIGTTEQKCRQGFGFSPGNFTVK